MASKVGWAIPCSPYATVLNFKPSLSPSVCRLPVDVCHNILTSYGSTKRIYLV